MGAMSSAPSSKDDFFAASAQRQSPPSRDQRVEGLRQQLERWGAVDAADNEGAFSSGVPSIDRLLGGAGLRRGMLIEWVGSEERKSGRAGEQQSRGGASTLGLLGAREACGEGGVLVVIDRRQAFYPPSAAAWGIDLERLIVVHPQNARDELWAAVQALRSPVVGAMWAAIDRLDSRAFRRLQLAAQAGRALGVLIRPTSARDAPSWADVTLEVRSKIEDRESSTGIQALNFCRRLQVSVLRCRLGPRGSSVLLEIDDATHTVQPAKEDQHISTLSHRPRCLANS